MAHRYSINSSTLHTTHLTQVRGTAVMTGSTRAEITPGGSVDRGAVILSHADPTATLETADLATALAAISPTVGLNCTTGATFRAQRRAAGGVFAGAGNHVLLTADAGFAVPSRLTVRQDDPSGANLSLAFWALSSDGFTAPLTETVEQNLANSPTFVGKWFLGPVTYDGDRMPGVLGWEVDFGLGYSPKRHDGEVFAREGAIIARRPVFRFTVDELDNAATIGNLFLAALGGNIVLYARKGAPGGTRVADATEQHIAVTATAGAWGVSDVSVQGVEADYGMTIEVIPTGTISVSTAAAIPAEA